MKNTFSPNSFVSWGRLQGILGTDESFFMTETRPKSSTSKASPCSRLFNRSYAVRTPSAYSSKFSKTKTSLNRIIKSRVTVPGLKKPHIKKLFEAKCQDLKIFSCFDQEKRFFEFCFRNCRSRKLDFKEIGLGLESSKVLQEILKDNRHFAFINLSKNNLKDGGCLNISEGILKSLGVVHLDISSNDLTCEGVFKVVKKLSESESLISLDLRTHEGHRKNRVGTQGAKGVACLLQSSPVITYINLSNTSLTTKGLNFIVEALEKNLSLSSLNISYNHFSNKVMEKLANSIVSSNLSELAIAGNRIGNYGLQVVSKMLKGGYDGFALIEKLDVSDNEIDSQGLKSLFQALCTNNQLISLNLKKNDFSSGLSECFFEFLVENYSLKSLNLSHCRLSCDSFYGLSEFFYRNKGITSWNLANNDIREKGAELIANAVKLSKTLKILDFSGNKIKETGGLALAKALEENNSICRLVLKTNDLQDSNIFRFSEVARKKQNLLRLNLENNPCSGRFIEKLEKSLEKNLKQKQKVQGENVKQIVKNLQTLNMTLEELSLKIEEKRKEGNVLKDFLHQDRSDFEVFKAELKRETLENKKEFERLREDRFKLASQLKELNEEVLVTFN
jgi:Ran GTPase-activating protein (RanGAP) involved in mRNA processing and transport